MSIPQGSILGPFVFFLIYKNGFEDVPDIGIVKSCY